MWSAVLRADDLPAGTVRLVEIDGVEVLVFRTPAGALHALESRCPHMGNHMPNGLPPGSDLSGLLQGEWIECPFHGWRFDGSGRCVAMPAGQRRPACVTAGKRLMRAWDIRASGDAIEIGRSKPPETGHRS